MATVALFHLTQHRAEMECHPSDLRMRAFVAKGGDPLEAPGRERGPAGRRAARRDLREHTARPAEREGSRAAFDKGTVEIGRLDDEAARAESPDEELHRADPRREARNADLPHGDRGGLAGDLFLECGHDRV